MAKVPIFYFVHPNRSFLLKYKKGIQGRVLTCVLGQRSGGVHSPILELTHLWVCNRQLTLHNCWPPRVGRLSILIMFTI